VGKCAGGNQSLKKRLNFSAHSPYLGGSEAS
jgi:hypothetical protein